MVTFLQEIFVNLKASPTFASVLAQVFSIALVVLLAIAANYLAKRGINQYLTAFAKKTKNQWDDLLLEKRVVTRLSHIVPMMVVTLSAPIVFPEDSSILGVVETVASVYTIAVILAVIDAALNVAVVAYNRLSSTRKIPVKGFVQAVKLVVFCVGAIFIISAIIGKSPTVLVTGLGAMTAVLLLVFRDPIMGLVAGIQLSVNNMVSTGDWIEMPQKGADGDVIDVSLTTVKVQNWDKTITTIPTYTLISESFKNWRGMKEIGGRRIKRCLYLDLNSIQFLSPEEIEGFRRFSPITAYLDAKLADIEQHHNELGLDPSEPKANLRSLTNAGTFRAYCEAWLRAKPEIHGDLTFLVRQLQPTPEGLPIEIYLFTKTTVWAEYEAIQADIFDHLIAVLPEFGLRLYQAPSGNDFSKLA